MLEGTFLDFAAYFCPTCFFQITHLLEWMMHMISNLESDLISMERITEYTCNPTEVRTIFFVQFTCAEYICTKLFLSHVELENDFVLVTGSHAHCSYKDQTQK